MSTYDLPAPIEPQPWQMDALCAQVDPELRFPDGSAPHGSQTTQDAIAMCHRCPVQQRCLEYALDAEGSQYWKSRYGIYGGLRPIERYSIYVQSRERECAECGKTFQYTHAHTRFCSNRCRHAARRERERRYEAARKGATA